MMYYYLDSMVVSLCVIVYTVYLTFARPRSLAFDIIMLWPWKQGYSGVIEIPVVHAPFFLISSAKIGLYLLKQIRCLHQQSLFKPRA